MADVDIEGLRLPGIGWRYDLGLPRDVRLVVVVEDGGPRHLMITRAGQDDALVSVSLTSDQALALATLLTGARFTVTEARQATRPVGWPAARHGVAIESVVVEADSPAVGVPASEVRHWLGPEAELLGVLSEETPEILEAEPQRPCHAGDRLVLAVRRSHAARVLAVLRESGGQGLPGTSPREQGPRPAEPSAP